MESFEKELKSLNDAQKQAVKHKDGPLLVVAGAGTGKTKVIVDRIIKLINDGVEPESILALTFTEKAANEMQDRVNELRGGYNFDVMIRTYNAFGQEMLEQHAFEIGLSGEVRLVGDIGKLVILREHLDELGLDYFAPVTNPSGQLKTLANYFSLLKQQVITPGRYKEYADNLSEANQEDKTEKRRHKELAGAYETFIGLCRQRGVVDYDDQIYLLIELLEKRPNIQKKLGQRFKYILVDEYQDTNPMQSQLLKLLTKEHQNLMVVGDDDQSIYGWRGATLSNILHFSHDYPKAKTVTLIENYRSGQDILDAAYSLIQNNNPDRLEAMQKLDKKLIARAGKSKAPSVHEFADRDAEFRWIAEDIARRLKAGEEPGEIAVLVRSNPTAQKVHQALQLADVEHVLAGITSDMYDHPAVVNMIEILKSVVDPHDSQALYHTLGGPAFRLDSHRLAEMSASANRTHRRLEETIKESEADEFKQSLETLGKWRKQVHDSGVAHLSYTILRESGLLDEYSRSAENSAEEALRTQAVGQWLNSLLEFERFSDVASTQSYLNNLDALRAQGETLEDESLTISSSMVNIMTIHKAKGLEWDTVYIADCTEQSLPARKQSRPLDVPPELMVHSEADEHMPEERRLMYVAATRAKDNLIITHSQTHTGKTSRKPSRFISEMFGDGFESSRPEAAKQAALELFDPENLKSDTPPSLPARMKQGDNLVLTVSQAGDYLRCPLDFKYRYILHIPGKPNATPVIGSLLHDLLNQINQARIKGKPLPNLDSLMKQLEEKWPKEGHESPEQNKRSYELAKRSLKSFYDSVGEQPVPIDSEMKFKFKVPDAPIILTGRMDAVIEGEKGVEIVDYKSSTNADSEDKAKDKARSSKQLTMYALAWREIKGEMPDKLTLDFIQTGYKGSVSKQPKSLDTVAKNLKEIAEGIQAGNFPPGYKHDFCRHPEIKD